MGARSKNCKGGEWEAPLFPSPSPVHMLQGRDSPAFRRRRVRVGDPSPAARCRGVFPAKVRAFTLARSCGMQGSG